MGRLLQEIKKLYILINEQPRRSRTALFQYVSMDVANHSGQESGPCGMWKFSLGLMVISDLGIYYEAVREGSRCYIKLVYAILGIALLSEKPG